MSSRDEDWFGMPKNYFTLTTRTGRERSSIRSLNIQNMEQKAYEECLESETFTRLGLWASMQFKEEASPATAMDGF